MFSLVKFSNGEHSVVSSERVKLINDKNCIVRFKTGAKYQAHLVRTSDSEENLNSFYHAVENESGKDLKKLIVRIEKSPLINRKTKLTENNQFNLQQKSGDKSSTIIDGKPQQLMIYSYNKNNVLSKERGIKVHSNVSFTKKNKSQVCQHSSINKENDINASNTSDSDLAANKSHSALYLGNVQRKFISTPLGDFESSSNEFSISQIFSEKSINNTEIEGGSNFSQVKKQMKETSTSSKTAVSKENSLNMVNDNQSISTNITDKSNSSDPNDSNYCPNESTNTTTCNLSKSGSCTIPTKKSSSFDQSPSANVQKLEVPLSRNNIKANTKKHFCLYCHTLQSKFARHLITKHKNEEDVKKLLTIPKCLPERKVMIDKIRKKGDFLHNVKAEYNTGILISSRQRQQNSKNTAEDYVCCKTCKAFFSKRTIRIHFKRCDQTHEKGARHITVSGKRLSGFIHSKAENVLRRVVFPVLRDDDVTRSIKYDELIILFGNKLCNKYTLDHQHDMIRAQLRLLGRFKLAMKDLDPEVTDFASFLKPQKFDSAIIALRTVAKWDTTSMWFKTPAVAQNLTTLIKKMAHKYRTECIKVQDEVNKKNVEDFLLLWEEEVPILINKKALEDQVLQKRQKKCVLPSKHDIKLLFDYLKKEARIAYNILEKKIDIAAWNLLSECTLILIQIFNRRRAGEIERLKLSDFQNKEALDENVNKDLFSNLSEDTIQYAKQYVRLTLRGKLSRTVPVLLSPFIVEYIEILIKYRKEVGIRSDNEYVFAVPSGNSLKKKYIRACPLMRRFSNECGAVIPSALRGTTLRKHIATFTAMLDIEDTQVDRLANFMGHDKAIHKNIYRVPVPVAEMTDVSRLLVAAMGGDDEGDDDGAQSGDQNSDSSDDDVLDDSENIERNGFLDSYSQSNNSSANSSDNKERKRSTSPYGKTKRTKWSESEKEAVTSSFGNLLNLKKLPSLEDCQAVIKKFKVLRNRQPQQLKAFIDNQRKQKARREEYKRKKMYI